MTNLFDLLFYPKPVLILLAIGEKDNATSGSVIARETLCTWCHVIKILQKFEDEGIITTKLSGRKKLITLTKDGRELLEFVKGIQKKIEEMNIQKKNGKK